jgi:hypothetical protein
MHLESYFGEAAMTDIRVPLYDRLPEIYRIKDAEQTPPYLLKHYLAMVETVFGEIHKNIEALYHDLFIETCDPWVIPYLGDLLGNSALKGDPQTLRMEVADTIAMRRRKGTLTALEMLAYDLTGWAVHGAELRDNLVWAQSLNHQRPDADGIPPYSISGKNLPAVPRGGTLPLRDPALLALLNTPFDPFSHMPDLRQVDCGQLRYNLPNLALFLWRLQEYKVPISKPVWDNISFQYADPDVSQPVSPAPALTKMLYAACFHIHPLGKPVRLFNNRRFDPQQAQVLVSQADEMPGPIHPARLTSDSPAGCPEEYICVECYDTTDPDLKTLDIGPLGLQLHVPQDFFQENTADHAVWRFRGADLSNWAGSLHTHLSKYEVAVDPVLGRIILPVENQAQVDALKADLLVTYTYGAVGPVGSHPISREALADNFIAVHHDPDGLKNALMNLDTAASSVVIEIQDSMVHDLDLGANVELVLNQSLVIRAASGQRPIIRLQQPLRFLPARVQAANPLDQPAYDAFMDTLTVRLEGLYLTRGEGWPANPAQPGYPEEQDALIQRAAVHSLEIIGCSLDPGGRKQADGSREAIRPSLRLENQYGFTESEADFFNQIPEIIIQKSITGPLQIDMDYLLFLSDSIVDAGQGTDQTAEADHWDQFAVTAANLKHGEVLNWGPEIRADGVTFFGRVHVRRLSGKGGIWVQLLEVEDNQHGCIKNSYFSRKTKISDLPSNYGCVSGVDLLFSSEYFEEPDYGRLDGVTDVRVREHGPGDEAMGATNCLWEAHKWLNLKIRFREFMPVGVRPLLVAVT